MDRGVPTHLSREHLPRVRIYKLQPRSLRAGEHRGKHKGDKMLTCANCGTQNSSRQLLCQNCGSPFSPNAQFAAPGKGQAGTQWQQPSQPTNATPEAPTLTNMPPAYPM